MLVTIVESWVKNMKSLLVNAQVLIVGTTRPFKRLRLKRTLRKKRKLKPRRQRPRLC